MRNFNFAIERKTNKVFLHTYENKYISFESLVNFKNENNEDLTVETTNRFKSAGTEIISWLLGCDRIKEVNVLDFCISKTEKGYGTELVFVGSNENESTLLKDRVAKMIILKNGDIITITGGNEHLEVRYTENGSSNNLVSLAPVKKYLSKIA